MSISKATLALLLVLAVAASAVVPFESTGPKSTLIVRPNPAPAVFGLTTDLPGGESLTPSPIHYRIDPPTGKPQMIIGYPMQIEGFSFVNEQNAPSALMAFIAQHSDLFGVDAADLQVAGVERSKDRAVVTLSQNAGGLPVWGGHITAMILPDATISYISNKLVPEIQPERGFTMSEEQALSSAIAKIAPRGEPRRIDRMGMFAFPLWRDDGFDSRTVWAFRILADDPVGLWQVMVSTTNGEIVAISNELVTVEHSGKIQGQYHPEFKDDPLQTGNWQFAEVKLSAVFTGYTDIGGNWLMDIAAASPNFSTTHKGRYCDIRNDAGAVASYNAGSFTSPFDFTWTTSTSATNQMNLYYHTNVMHTYVKDTLGYSGMDYSVPSTVNYSAMSDNANWDGYGMNFGAGATIFYDMSLFCDVIYHEYTHGVTGRIYPSGTLPYSGQSGAINEGLSDYFACSMTDSPLMGDGGLYRGGTAFMRRVNRIKVFPDDFVDQVHSDGEIISGAWWAIRTELGRFYTDSLIHLTRFLHPEDFEAFFWATLATDDDDGDLTNGTPNGRLIYESYGVRGIGPGFALNVEHRPLKNTEITTGVYRVEATFFATLGLSTDSISVKWRVDGGEWNRAFMSESFGVYRGFIPAQPLGSVVDYYIDASDNGGNAMMSPVGAPDEWHTFRVETDVTSPSIIAMPIGSWFEYAWPPQLQATITDDQGILSARIHGRIGDTDLTPSPLAETDEWNVYTGVLPGSPAGRDTVEYWIEATDISAAANTGIFPPSGTFKMFVYPGYLEDFEVANRGYSSYSIRTGYVDQWNRVPQNNPHTSGDFCFYFGSGSEYTDRADGALETPDLSIGSPAYLKFWHTMDAEDDGPSRAWDGGIVEVSTDGGETWFQANPEPGYNRTIRSNPASPFEAGTPCYSSFIAWRKDSIDMSIYAPKARVRFRFGSDAYVTAGGWFIDDIELVTDPTNVAEKSTRPEQLGIHLSPNPFNAALRIEIEGTENSAKLEIFDISGRLVRKYDVGEQTGHIIWDGKDHSGDNLPGGVYLVRISGDSQAKTKKAVLIK